MTYGRRRLLAAVVGFLLGLCVVGAVIALTGDDDDVDGEFVLGPIDLTIAPGEVTFLIGGNGSGKTTLAKLLVGLYAPEQGRVLIDGVEITDQTREAHRAHCSAVFSDFHLFDALWGLDGEAEHGAARAGRNALQR